MDVRYGRGIHEYRRVPTSIGPLCPPHVTPSTINRSVLEVREMFV